VKNVVSILEALRDKKDKPVHWDILWQKIITLITQTS
jgi:hypothetical protein